MPSNTKEIRNRIKSVENTQKVTRSMKLIATIKLKQVQNLYHTNHIYFEYFNQLFAKLAQHIDFEHIPENLPILQSLKSQPKSDTQKKVALVILSSDRGLCGAYNAQLFKLLKQKIETYKSAELILIPVGKKAVLHVQKAYPNLKRQIPLSNLGTIPKSDEANILAQTIYSLAVDTGVIEIVQNRYHSSVKVLPEEFKVWSLQELVSDRAQAEKRELLLEPNAFELMEKLLPLYFKNVLFEAMLSAKAGELAMRVNAMTSATDNAKGLIELLRLSFNKARQANITQEISEIVAGASSVM